MVRLLVLPNQGIISGFKQKVDFYLYMGVPCARRWPRAPSAARSAGVQSGWAAFTYAAQNWQTIPQVFRDALTAMSQTSDSTGRDLFMKSYLSGLFPQYRNDYNPE